MPVQCIRSPDPEGERLAFLTGCRQMTFAEVLAGWRDAPAVRTATIAALAATAHPSIFWEMPGLDHAALGQPYECLLLPAPRLAAVAPDARPFAEALAASPASVVAFDNLGGDARLIVPQAEGPRSAYGHIAAFAREAPDAQRHALLRALAETAVALLERRPVWISTSGLGVALLHVRLDTRPKYYACRRYREALMPRS